MKLGKMTCFGVLAATGLALSACGSGYDRPQKEHTFTGNLTEAQRAQAPYNSRIRDRISDQETAEQYKRLVVKIAKLESDSPFAGLGFLPHKSVAYAVQRDSHAALFSHNGKLNKLDKLLTHVDRAEIAGDHGTRILGLSPVRQCVSIPSRRSVIGNHMYPQAQYHRLGRQRRTGHLV